MERRNKEEKDKKENIDGYSLKCHSRLVMEHTFFKQWQTHGRLSYFIMSEISRDLKKPKTKEFATGRELFYFLSWFVRPLCDISPY